MSDQHPFLPYPSTIGFTPRQYTVDSQLAVFDFKPFNEHPRIAHTRSGFRCASGQTFDITSKIGPQSLDR